MSETSTVQASVLHGIKDLRVVSHPSPLQKHQLTTNKEEKLLSPPSPTEVQVQVQATGLCGSDLHYFNHYRNGDIIVREPLTLGHESAGTVSAVGSSVTSLKVGDKVALEVGLPCKKCDRCVENRYNICKEMRFRSSAKSFPHFQGTLQGKINQEADFCYKLVLNSVQVDHWTNDYERLPDSVPLEMGAILEPLSVAMHASRRANLPAKSKVLIFGAGAVGLLCAATAKFNGASEVIIADIQGDRVDFAIKNNFADSGVVVPMKRPQAIEEKLEFAKEVAGLVAAKELVRAGTSVVGEVDAVFECTGVESCLQAAIYVSFSRGALASLC